jgi:glutaconate CoA-transferase subunit B
MGQVNREHTPVELAIAAAARAWADDGEVLASGLGLAPRLAAGLARLTLNPDLLMTDGECMLVSEPVPVGPRRGYEPKVEGWLPFRAIFELLWSGRRHAMTTPTQIDRWGQTNISVIGDYGAPKVALLGVRGIPGNSINHPCSFFIPDHNRRVFVEKVDMVCGVGHDPARWAGGLRRDFHQHRLLVSNLGVFDFKAPGGALRLTHLHPGVTVDEVRENTAFELQLAGEVAATPPPTASQLEALDRLDPHNLRNTVFKER